MSSPHKLSQLCRQVEEAVQCALLSSADAALRDLCVVGVEPVRGAALLRVLVFADLAGKELVDIDGRLERARGYLRGEVAHAIHRKRVPGLELVVVPAV